MASCNLDYDFLKYFKLTYRFGLDTSTEHHDMGEPNMSVLFKGTPNWDAALSSLTGRVSEQTTRRREINQDLLVMFDKDLTDSWHINALVGFNGNERKYNYQSAEVTNLTIPTWYNLTNTADKPTIDSYQRTQRLMGVLGQAEVAFKNMVYLTLTARNDWSSTLPRAAARIFILAQRPVGYSRRCFQRTLRRQLTTPSCVQHGERRATTPCLTW